MFSSADKITKSSAIRQQSAGTTFFRKAGEETFFGAKENPSFFKAPIQAKLKVSTPDDPEEKEADQVAEKVMRMPNTVTASAINDKKEEKVQTKPADNIRPVIQRKVSQGQGLQAKLNNQINTSLYHSDILRQSGRGPPAGSIPFEQTLASSKGGGSAMPGDTQQFMESRFNADFSGVRVHTGSTAVQLSSSIQAKAFAHGNDIYFNSGQFSPNSSQGGALLAHELAHTIQQGASKTINPSRNDHTQVNKKDLVPSQSNDLKKVTTDEVSAKAHSDQNIIKKKEAATVVSADVKAIQNTTPKNVSAKPAVVNASVQMKNIVASPVMKVMGKGILKKEVFKKDDPEEKESASSITEGRIQSKASDKSSAGHINEQHRSGADPQQYVVQKAGVDSDVQTITSEAPDNIMLSVQGRGPPIQAVNDGSEKRMIQRSLFDSALGRVGELLSDIPLTLDVDVAKRWLLNGVRRFASYIPGYRALGVVLGHDPITGDEIERNGHNLIEAALDIIPGGTLIKQKLEELGLIDRAATWIDTQIAALSGLVQTVRNEFTAAWDTLGVTSILEGPMNILRTFGGIFERGINNIIDFARRAATELVEIVKRFLLTQVVDFIKQHTNAYELLKVIIGKDPITDEPVQRNGTNILNALLEMGGDAGREQRRQMQETHSFEKAAAWIDRGISVFGDLYSAIRSGFSHIWDFVSINALMHPVDTFNQIYQIFAAPVTRVMDFVRDALAAILGFIKEALMTRLSAWARTIRGYPLVTVLLGKDPFTNANVTRNVENIIRGFMSLMEGGEEQFNQLQQSGVIGRTVQRIMAAVARLNMTPEYVVQLFTDLWNSFTFADLASPMAAFERIMARFGEPIGRLLAFVVEIIKIVVEVVMQVMNFPSDLIGNIIARAMQAFEMIKRDPVGFLKNLLRAIKQGFIQFFGNIGRHLLAGLQGWLMSELRDSGVQAPQDFTLRGIIGWVLKLLGITIDKIWEKLAQHPRVGPQRVARIRGMINQLEGIWTFIKDVQQRGMAAIWEKIQERLSSLWETILDAVKNWIMEQVVNRVTARLLSMLDPTGIMAVINGAIALYNAVQSFVRYLRQMLEIVNSFVEGVVQIASGNIGVAANFLERSMARGVPIMIGFLANQVGLSGLGRRISEMIGRVRELVDQALTWLVNRAVDMGMNLLDRVMGAARGAVAGGGTPEERLNNGLRDAQGVVNRFAGRRTGAIVLRPLLAVIKLRYGFQTLDVVARGQNWAVRGQVNPEGELATNAMIQEGGTETAQGTPEDEASLRVRNRVAAALQTEVGEGKSEQEIRTTVNAIAERFRPEGLRRLVAAEKDEQNDIVISAEASPLYPLGRFRSLVSGAIPPGRSVTTAARINLSSTWIEQERNIPKVSGHVARGGEFLSQLNAALNQLDTYTWNTTPALNATNETHAERQFVDWLMDPARRILFPFIERITIRNFSKSPCTGCTDHLRNLLRTIRDEQTRELGSVILQSADIFWATQHGGVGGSTWPSLIELADSGWHCHAPEGGFPPIADLQTVTERSGRTGIYANFIRTVERQYSNPTDAGRQSATPRVLRT